MNRSVLLSFILLIASVGQAHALLDRNSRIIMDGRSMSLMQLFQEWEKCQATSNIQRGEYEKKEEFKIRKQAAQKSCDGLKRPKVEVLYKTKLKYNVDEEYFSFNIDYVRGSGGSGWHMKGRKSILMRFTVLPKSKKWRFGADKRYFGNSGSFDDNYNFSTFKVRSEVKKARQLKALEEGLKTKFSGILHISKEGPSDHPWHIFEYYIDQMNLYLSKEDKNVLNLVFE